MPKKIILIENDKFLGDVLAQKLTQEHYTVQWCTDGAQGFTAIKDTVPDLVLLDMEVPTMNGYEILEAKQRIDSLAGIPVVVISNSGQPVEVSRTKALGAVDHIIKADIHVADVLQVVRTHTGQPDTASNTTAPKIKNVRVLFVEDDSFLSDLIAQKLNAEGAVLLHAQSGESALHILEREVPDVILLDVILSGMSGFDVLEKIKQQSTLTKVPVMIFSNLGQETDKEKALALGAARYYIKAHLTPHEIVEQIRAVLGAQ